MWLFGGLFLFFWGIKQKCNTNAAEPEPHLCSSFCWNVPPISCLNLFCLPHHQTDLIWWGKLTRPASSTASSDVLFLSRQGWSGWVRASGRWNPSLPRSDPNGTAVLQLIIHLSGRPTDAITGALRGWNRTLRMRIELSPRQYDNNPQQYCGSCGVKLMSMFPFIERRITASGSGEAPISDCQRSIWLCATDHRGAAAERATVLIRAEQIESCAPGMLMAAGLIKIGLWWEAVEVGNQMQNSGYGDGLLLFINHVASSSGPDASLTPRLPPSPRSAKTCASSWQRSQSVTDA